MEERRARKGLSRRAVLQSAAAITRAQAPPRVARAVASQGLTEAAFVPRPGTTQ